MYDLFWSWEWKLPNFSNTDILGALQHRNWEHQVFTKNKKNYITDTLYQVMSVPGSVGDPPDIGCSQKGTIYQILDTKNYTPGIICTW